MLDTPCDVFKNTTCVPFSLNWMHWVCIVAAVCYLLTRGHIFLHISPLSCVLWTASEMLSLRKCKDAVNFFCFWLVSHPLGPSIHHQSSPPSSLQCDGQQCGAILENYFRKLFTVSRCRPSFKSLHTVCKLKSIHKKFLITISAFKWKNVSLISLVSVITPMVNKYLSSALKALSN